MSDVEKTVEAPEEKILPPEAVEAATQAIDEAVERAEAAGDFPDREQVMSSLTELKGLLNGILEKIDKLGEIKERELSIEESLALQLAGRSNAEKFFGWLNRCFSEGIVAPDGLRLEGEGAGGGGRDADQEEGGEA